MSRGRGLLLVAASLAISMARGCTSVDIVTQSSGGGFGATSTTGYTGSSTSSSNIAVTSGFGGYAEPDPCLPKPLPDVVPDGWEESLDWSCKCRLYVPKSAAALPTPIKWEPCPDAGDGLACQSMVMDWGGEDSYIAANPSMDRNPDGSAVLQFVRYVNQSYSIHIVADADGPVRTAMYFVWGGKNWGDLDCRPTDDGVKEGKFITHLRGDDIDHWLDYQGARGGNIDDLHPPVLIKYSNVGGQYSQSWTPGANGTAAFDANLALNFNSWDMKDKYFITSTTVDIEGMSPGYVKVRNGAVFWETGDLYRAGINVWDKPGGARSLIRWPGDFTRGAGKFGTDGTDMVWCQGEGKAPSATEYPVRSIMTAPFMIDPAKLQPRRLRSLPTNRIAGAPTEVGCGYALLEGPAGDLIVTRLSDGWLWYVPQTPERRIYTALGLTCTELFAVGEMHQRLAVARVRLDSLGPGFPPD